LIVFYFVSTVTGFFGQLPHRRPFSVGSSAGIFGLIGAMLAFGFTDRSSLGMQVKSLYTRWVIYGLVLSFMPGVDFGRTWADSRADSWLDGWPARRARA
jgi:membrane associated rhomboid family serine protease